ncbi:MAG: histidinol phosphate phosphatase domain-containing protein, partial [Nitrospirota bacterium]
MIDLHTHSLFSDGELLPAELIRRASVTGYKAIAITDHVDQSNIDMVIPRIVKALKLLKGHIPITALPGAEITHVPPALIPSMVKEARQLGAKIVIVLGETIAEPVEQGTNKAAIGA